MVAQLPLGEEGFVSLVFMATGCGFTLRGPLAATTALEQNLALPPCLQWRPPTGVHDPTRVGENFSSGATAILLNV